MIDFTKGHPLSDIHRDAATRYCYVLFGLTFTSDVALSLPSGSASSKISFSLRAATTSEVDATRAGPATVAGDEWTQCRQLASGEYEVELKDWLSLRAERDGRTITYRVHASGGREAFEAHIANYAASIALLLQGEETLHSTVIWIDGRGVGLLGPSGAGKSTFAAHLLGQGAELVTDDLLRITETGHRLFAEPGPPRLKLFAHTADRHFSHQWPHGKWNPLSQKYLFPTAGPSDVRLRRPLDALVFLAPPAKGMPDAISMNRLKGLELFRAISGSTMIASFNTPERMARQFAFLENISKFIPVYSLNYPRRDDIFPELLSLVKETIA